MNESVLPNTESDINHHASKGDLTNYYRTTPLFSMRKLRIIYNELTTTSEFEYANFDAFKHQVLNSVAPQLELNKWQTIAARR